MSAVIFLLIRVSHILLAAVWLGAVVYTAVFVMPAVAESGPAGGQVMDATARRGLTPISGRRRRPDDRGGRMAPWPWWPSGTTS